MNTDETVRERCTQCFVESNIVVKYSPFSYLWVERWRRVKNQSNKKWTEKWDKEKTTKELSARLLKELIGGLVLLEGNRYTWKQGKSEENGKNCSGARDVDVSNFPCAHLHLERRENKERNWNVADMNWIVPCEWHWYERVYDICAHLYLENERQKERSWNTGEINRKWRLLKDRTKDEKYWSEKKSRRGNRERKRFKRQQNEDLNRNRMTISRATEWQF